MLRHYELFLACRYLKKKRLAFFSVAAVALSVAMLIVVSSVTGGFVEQFRGTCHSFYGDVIVRADSLMGFPYYQELIDQARELEEVQAATAVVKQFGLLRIDQPGRFKLFVKGVNILGIDPVGYAEITNFKEGLYKQSKLPGPPKLDIPDDLPDDPYLKRSNLQGACIVGVEVPYNRRPGGGYDRKSELYNSPVLLTTVPLKHTGLLDMEGRVNYAFVLIDDSETAVPLVDEQTVYIHFDVAQQMSRMAGYRTDDGLIEPARASQVQIRAVPGADLETLRDRLRVVWEQIAEARGYLGAGLVFETWYEQEGISRLIAQLEHERILMTILFLIMDVVSVFLILCIFFVIVTEKIPDIGILKSVGASGPGVGRIFLVYAMAVGLIGALLGLAMGWPFVVHINTIHDWISHTFGWQIYDPSVLLFPHIPNEVDWAATLKLMIASVAGCLVGSMIPAIRAAMMKPIKALRYE